MTTTKTARAAESRDYLTTVYGVQPGTTLVTLVTSVARSGMSRRIRVFVPDATSNKGVREITHHVAHILGCPSDPDKGGMLVSGCGMDMGFHVVYSLSVTLFGDSYALSQAWL